VNIEVFDITDGFFVSFIGGICIEIGKNIAACGRLYRFANRISREPIDGYGGHDFIGTIKYGSSLSVVTRSIRE